MKNLITLALSVVLAYGLAAQLFPSIISPDLAATDWGNWGTYAALFLSWGALLALSWVALFAGFLIFTAVAVSRNRARMDRLRAEVKRRAEAGRVGE